MSNSTFIETSHRTFGPGLEVRAVAGYAEAAAALFAAAPWRLLGASDLLAVRTTLPVTPRLSHVGVFAVEGVIFGLVFYESEAAHRDEAQAADLGVPAFPFIQLAYQLPEFALDGVDEVWREYGFMHAGGDKVRWLPVLAEFDDDGGAHFLSNEAVVYVQGLCLALAATTEAQVDSGQWSVKVETVAGPAEYSFSIPSLLEALNGVPRPALVPDLRLMDRLVLTGQFTPEEADAMSDDEALALLGHLRERGAAMPAFAAPQSAREEAEQLCFEALECEGRRRLQLVRKALAISPDAVEAYSIMALLVEHDMEERIAWFAKGIEAGLRVLGPGVLEPGGAKWSDLGIRPYLRARWGLAQTLADLDRAQEAAAEFALIMAGDPEDALEARYPLLEMLIALGDLDRIAKLVDGPWGREFDSSSELYLKALLDFRQTGPSTLARRRVVEATEANRFVPNFLLGRKQISEDGLELDETEPGSVEEAEAIVYSQEPLWAQVPGALVWLAGVIDGLEGGGPRGARRRRR